MRTVVNPIFFLALTWCLNHTMPALTFGQDEGFVPFSGRGIEDSRMTRPETKESYSWFGKKEGAPEKEPFRLFGGQGVMRPATPAEVQDRPRLFGNLFQKPDPNQPGLLERGQAKSREMMDRTKNWANEKNQALKQRTAQSWDTLTAGLRPADRGTEKAPTPPDAPTRIAEKPNSDTQRF